MTAASDKDERDRPRWRLEPYEIPAELADNFIIQYLARLSREEEAALEALSDGDVTAQLE